jgi:4-hydroxybenzoate polyprenyltransferase
LLFTIQEFNFLIYSISDGVSCGSPVLWCFAVGSEVDVIGFDLFDRAHFIEPYRRVGLNTLVTGYGDFRTSVAKR